MARAWFAPRMECSTIIRCLAWLSDSDVADGSQAPQLVSDCRELHPAGCSATLSNLNATNTFQGLLGCLPAAFNYLPNQQRFNPTPNAPSISSDQAFLNPAAPVPLSFLPFSFPTAKNFQYAVSHQANLTFEQDLGHDMSFSLAYNFNGGRHLNRPINANAVKPGPLLANWQVALGDPTSGAATLGPEGVGAAGTPCGFNGSGQPWVADGADEFLPSLGTESCAGPGFALVPSGGLRGVGAADHPSGWS